VAAATATATAAVVVTASSVEKILLVVLVVHDEPIYCLSFAVCWPLFPFSIGLWIYPKQ